MTDEFFEDENVDDGENNLEYDRDIFDIEIEFDDEVVNRIERTKATREFEKLIFWAVWMLYGLFRWYFLIN